MTAEFDWRRVDSVTPENRLRVLFSACTLGNATGWEGAAYTEPLAVRLASLPLVEAVSFCPEHATLGTPRPLTTLHDGHGRDVLHKRGRARVLETTGRDVTAEIVRGAEAMLDREGPAWPRRCSWMRGSPSSGNGTSPRSAG